jgi:hypothetical protein
MAEAGLQAPVSPAEAEWLGRLVAWWGPSLAMSLAVNQIQFMRNMTKDDTDELLTGYLSILVIVPWKSRTTDLAV